MHTGHGRTLLLYEHTRRPPKAEVQAYPIYVSCAQEQMRTVLKTAEKQIRIFIHAQQARHVLKIIVTSHQQGWRIKTGDF